MYVGIFEIICIDFPLYGMSPRLVSLYMFCYQLTNFHMNLAYKIFRINIQRERELDEVHYINASMGLYTKP